MTLPIQCFQHGERGFIAPGTDQHGRLITASKVASILGVSRWESSYSLWHRMRGNIGNDPPKDIFKVGLAFEKALAELWRLQNPGWRLSRGEVQFVTERFGFPAMATIDRRAVRGRARRIIEFKIARDLSEWGDPDLAGDLPMDYVTQVIFQQMVSGITDTANVVVMGPFFKNFTYNVQHDEVIADWIVGECIKFWESLQNGVEPKLDNSVSSYSAIKKVYPDMEDYDIEVPEDLVSEIKNVKSQLSQHEDRERELRIQLLDLMGNAQRATINGEIVARRKRHSKGGVTLVLV